MDFRLSEEQQMIQEMMQRFVENELRPLEPEVLARMETEGHHVELLLEEKQEDLRQTLMELGLWAMSVPEEFGGGGFDTLSACLVESELGKTFVPVDLGDVSPVLFECSPEQRGPYLDPVVAGDKRYAYALREPDGHAEEMETRAEPVDGGYTLSGRKLSGWEGKRADFFLVFAGAPEGITGFLVDREAHGLTVVESPAASGTRLILEDCTVPAENVLGAVGKGLQLGRQWFNAKAMKTSARYVGMADRLLEMAATYARDWETFGRPLAERPAVQRVLAGMASRADAARWSVYHGAWTVDQGQANEDDGMKIRVFTWEVLEAAIDGTTQVYGGPRYAGELPMLRIYESLVDYGTMESAMDRLRSTLSARVLDLAA